MNRLTYRTVACNKIYNIFTYPQIFLASQIFFYSPVLPERPVLESYREYPCAWLILLHLLYSLLAYLTEVCWVWQHLSCLTASFSVVIPFIYCNYIPFCAYIPLCGYIPFCGYILLWCYNLICGYIIHLLMVINLISFVRLL